MRKKLSEKTEAEILFYNRHICCICNEKNKDVQVHHIDEDNSNNELSNLAVLCLDCHSKVTGTRGLGRRYSSVELRRYKSEWESTVKESYGISPRQVKRAATKIEKQLFTFEIKRIIYDMISTDDSKLASLNKNFEMLWQIAILEGMEKVIIDQLGFAYALTAITEKNKPVALGRHLPNFFGYLVGPEDVPMSATTEKNILEAIEAIQFAHGLCLDQNKQYAILSSFKSCVSEFIRIAILYRKPTVYKKARKAMAEIRESAATIYYKGDAKQPRIKSEIDRFAKDTSSSLRKAKLSWKV
jgi:uncharacterized protein YaaR (DUF327 family)